MKNNKIESVSDFLQNEKTFVSNQKLLKESELNDENKNISNNMINDISNLSDNQNIKKIIFNKCKNDRATIKQSFHRSINLQQNHNNKNQFYLFNQDYIFSRCSYSSFRNYFFWSYFIRVYQFTLIRIVLNFSYLSYIKSKRFSGENDKLKINENEMSIFYKNYILANFIFYIWVIILPLGVLTYVRNNQNDLLSRKQIIKLGSLYLSYRGISKDVYAILFQLKFIIIPYFCFNFSVGGSFIYIICGLIFIFYIFFVTISKPFSKVMKVFNETLSYLILIIFCFSIIILEKIDNQYKDQMFSYYTYLSLVIALLVIRSFRIFIDTTRRIMEIKKMRMPKVIDYSKNLNLQNDQNLKKFSMNRLEDNEGIEKNDFKKKGENYKIKDEERYDNKDNVIDENEEFDLNEFSQVIDDGDSYLKNSENRNSSDINDIQINDKNRLNVSEIKKNNKNIKIQNLKGSENKANYKNNPKHKLTEICDLESISRSIQSKHSNNSNNSNNKLKNNIISINIRNDIYKDINNDNNNKKDENQNEIIENVSRQSSKYSIHESEIRNNKFDKDEKGDITYFHKNISNIKKESMEFPEISLKQFGIDYIESSERSDNSQKILKCKNNSIANNKNCNEDINVKDNIIFDEENRKYMGKNDEENFKKNKNNLLNNYDIKSNIANSIKAEEENSISNCDELKSISRREVMKNFRLKEKKKIKKK